MTCKKCKTLRYLLKAIYELVCGDRDEAPIPEPGPVTASFTALLSNGFQVTGTNMLIISRVDEKIVFTAAFADKFGNVVTEFGGPLQWSTSDESLAVLEVAADGLSASLTPSGKLGQTIVGISVDADPDADVELVGATADVTFKAGKAVIANFTSTVSDAVVEGPIVVPTDPTEPVVTDPTEPVPPVIEEPEVPPTPVEPGGSTDPVEEPATEEPVVTEPEAPTEPTTPVEEPATEEPVVTEPEAPVETPTEPTEPVAEVPVEEVPVEETPVEPTPAPAEEVPVEQPAEEAPAPAEESPIDPIDGEDKPKTDPIL